MRREFALVLLAGAAGAGLVVLAVRQAWAHAIFTAPKPLPAQDIPVTGQQLVPLAGALGLAALACLAAVIATRSVIRRAFGLLMAVLGAGTAAAAAAAVRAPAVLAGVATAWRGPRWPVMSARFERSSPKRRRGTDSASMWESLSHDVDPTVDDSTRT